MAINTNFLEYIHKIGWDTYLEGLRGDIELNAGPPPTRGYAGLLETLRLAEEQRASETEMTSYDKK